MLSQPVFTLMQRSRKYQFYSLWFDCSRLAIYYTTNGAYLLFCETLKSSSLEIDQGVGTFRKYDINDY
jgi:hypothetical protein